MTLMVAKLLKNPQNQSHERTGNPSQLLSIPAGQPDQLHANELCRPL